MKKALLIIDIQNDFCDGGPMSHNKSFEIIPEINSIRDNYDLVIFIKKSLQSNHSIFKNYGGQYPSHCIEGTHGCELHDNIIVKEDDIIISRGTLQKYDSNSAFYDAEDINKQTRLKYILQINNIKELFFCGNGLERCIFSTIMDAYNYRYKCYVIKDAVSYMNKEKYEQNIKYLINLGLEFV